VKGRRTACGVRELALCALLQVACGSGDVSGASTTSDAGGEVAEGAVLPQEAGAGVEASAGEGAAFPASEAGAGSPEAGGDATAEGPAGSCQASSNANFCVSPNGQGQTCSPSAPCSLQTAQSLVAQRTSNMQGDLTVELLGGVYAMESPLKFGVQDGGSNGHVVHYVAAAGASPVLSGGLRLQNWTLHDSTKGIYQTSVPAGFDTRQLYVNGKRAQRARTVLAAMVPDHAILGDGAHATSGGYSVTIPGMTSWTHVQNIEAVSNSWWEIRRCPLASVSQGEILVQSQCWANGTSNGAISMSNGLNWLENAYEFLTQPGQWYLDKTAGVMYYMPNPGEDLTTATVVAGQTEQLITGSGTLGSNGSPQFVQNLAFEGLTFAYATWLTPNASGYTPTQAGVGSSGPMLAHVSFSRAKDVTFLSNTFLHLGAAALNFDTGSQNITIQGNAFEDVSGSALQMGNPDDGAQTNSALQSSGHLISNNYASQTGVEYLDTPVFTFFFSANTVIEQNEVANAPYTGISFGWGWGAGSDYTANDLFKQNYIHDVMQSLFDGGGIYTNGAGGGTQEQLNYFDRIGSDAGPQVCEQGGGYHGYAALYHDNGGTNFSDSQNVITNMFCGGYWTLFQVGDTALKSMDEYVDVDNVEGCGGALVSGPSSCLNSSGNSCTGTTVFGQSPPAAAQAIMSGAGLTAQYQPIKKISPTGVLY